jgi:hypothetical protein
VAYGARLESGFTRKGIEGSNPSPSANKNKSTLYGGLIFVCRMGSSGECQWHSPPALAERLARDKYHKEQLSVLHLV